MNDHFIPCLLLARFSVDGSTGRKARVHQFNVHGPHPVRAVAAEDLAFAGDFYSIEDFPNLDGAGLLNREKAAARLISKLIEGADPSGHGDELSALFALQAARTRAFRLGVAERASTFTDLALSALESDDGLAFFDRMMRERLDKLGAIETLVKAGIEQPMAEMMHDLLGEERLRRLLLEGMNKDNLSQVMTLARTALDGGALASKAMASGQVKSLHKVVTEGTPEHVLNSARWVRVESPDEPLILGDACVVCCGNESTPGWMFKYGPNWKEVYLPIHPRLAIVGLAPDGPSQPSLTPSQLNLASAQLARDYIYASRNTQVERALAAQIGSVQPLLTDAELADTLRNHIQGEVPD